MTIHKILAVGFLVLAALACNAAAFQSIPAPATLPVVTVTPTAAGAPPPTPTASVAIPAGMDVEAALNEVDAGRLMDHVEALAGIHTRHANSRGAAEAAAYIRQQFEAIDGLAVTLDEFPLEFNDLTTTQANVIATLLGRDPAGGVVLVGAHYDSRSADLADAGDRAPGADDNATGVAALIEVARVLASLPERPQATVVFAAFAAEEITLAGSDRYVAAHPEQEIRAAFVLDIVGNAAGPAGNGAIRVFASPAHPGSQQAMRTLDVIAERMLPGFDVLLQPTADRPGRYSNHLSFSGAGIPALRLIEAVENPDLQHTPDDLPETISPAYLRQAAQLTLAGVLGAAELPPPTNVVLLSDDPPAATPDPADVTLSWSPVPGASGYLLGVRSINSLAFDAVIEIEEASYQGAELAAYDTVSVAAVDGAGRIGLFGEEMQLPFP